MAGFDPDAVWAAAGGGGGSTDTTGSGITKSLMAGVHGAAAGMGAIGGALGSQSGTDYMLDQQRLQQNYEAGAATRGIPQTTGDIHGPVDLLKYVGGQAAESAPMLGELAAGAVAGGIPDMALGAGTAAGRVLARQAATKLVEKGMTQEAAEAAVGKAIAKQAGGAAATYPGQLGQNLQSQYDQSGQYNLPAAAAGALPEAALNIVSPEGKLLSGAGMDAAATGSRIANAAIGAGKSAIGQGAVGAAQGGLQDLQRMAVDPNYKPDGSAEAEGAIGGAAMGAFLGAGHGLLHAPGAAGGISSRDIGTEAPAAIPANDPYSLLDSPTYQRQGIDILNPDNPQRSLDVTQQQPGRGGFAPGFDAKGNPVPDNGAARASNAAAADQGPTISDAVDGLTQMQQDLSDHLRQATLAEQQFPGTHGDAIQKLTDRLNEVQQHLSTLQGIDDRPQPSLDLADPSAPKGSLAQATTLFGDRDAQAQLAKVDIAPATPAPVPQPDASVLSPNRPPSQFDAYLAAQRARASGALPDANQAALTRVPPEPPNPNAQLALPPEAGGFKLAGNPTPMLEQPKPAAAPFQLAPPESNPAQREISLKGGSDTGDIAAPAADTKSGELFKPGDYGSKVPWQTRMRMAWKDTSDGGLQGFHKSMRDAVGAESAEDAAQHIRDKADDAATGTSYRKLDAMHQALTGESIEEARTREAQGESGAETPEKVAAGEGAGEAAAPGAAQEGSEAERAGVESGGLDHAVPRAEEAGAESPTAQVEEEATVNSSIAKLESTKSQSEFTDHVNRLYALSQDAPRQADRTKADVYLHDPENGVTDKQLEAAKSHYETKDAALRAEFPKVSRSENFNGEHEYAALERGTPKTGADVARDLAANAENPNIRRVMATLGKNVDLSNTSVERVGEGDQVHPAVRDALTSGANGVTSMYPKTGKVEVHVAEDAGQETVAHEMVHAGTLEALNDPAKAAPFQKIMADVAKRLGASDVPPALKDLISKHMLGDVKEFVAYATTNPTIQNVFKTLDKLAPKGPGLWERFKTAVMKALGVDKLFGKTVDDSFAKGHVRSPLIDQVHRAVEGLTDIHSEAATPEVERKYHALATSPDRVLGEGLKEGGLDIAKSIVKLGNKAIFGAMPTHAITDGFKHILPSLPDLQHAIEDRTVRQHTLARSAVDVHDAFAAANKAAGGLDRLHSVMEDAQMSQADPRKVSTIQSQAYLKVAQERLSTLPKGATELEHARAENHLKQAAAQARMADNWQKMSAPEKSAFNLATLKLRESLQTRQTAVNEALLRSRDAFSDATLDKMRADKAPEADIDKHIIDTYGRIFSQSSNDAYVPLKRYGDWVVSSTSKEYHAAEQELRTARTENDKSPAAVQRVKDATEMMQMRMADPDHRFVSFHDSSVQAEHQAADLRAAHPDNEVERFTRNDYAKHAPAMSASMLGKITDAVTKELPPELRGNIESLIRDMYVDSLPDGSFAQSQQQRAGVAGYSTDFSRAVLETLLRDSFQTSTIEHSDQMAGALRALDKERRTNGTDTANNIFGTLSKRIDATTNFKNFAKWEQRISEVTHAMYLGLSPGFLLMNMMQMPMITVPMLHARFGMHANGVLTKAIGHTWDAIHDSRLDPESSKNMTAEEKQVLMRLQNLGILNMTQMHDTATAAHASNIIDPKNLGEKASKNWETGKNLINLPAQYVETVNRASTALAAYRLAREGKSKFGAMDHGAAMDYAAKVVRDSHVDYSATNNPAWMKTGFAPGSRLLFQFKKYWLNMLSMVSMNMYDSVGHGKDIRDLRRQLADTGLSDDQRASKTEMLSQFQERQGVARRTLAGLYGMHFIHTGALGMPFAGAGIGLANVMRGWYSNPEDKADTQTDLKNYVAEAMGTQASDTLFKGIWSGLMGMDISQRIGMGDLASPVKVFDQKATGSDYGKELLAGLAGPTAGFGLNLMDAYKQAEAGNYGRAVEKMLPKAASNVLKATRRENDGGEVSPSGKMVTQTTDWDAVKQALGVAPEDVSNAYAAKNAVTQAKQQFDQTRSGLVKSAAQAGKANDFEAQQAASEKIREFNERNPGAGLSISPNDVMKARIALSRPPKALTGGAANKAARFNAEGDFAKDE